MHGTPAEQKPARTPPELRRDETRRLARIEGQVRGLSRMVEDDRYCVDILIQLAAVKEALGQVGRLVLKHHLENCVTESIKRDEPEVYAELMAIAEQFGSWR